MDEKKVPNLTRKSDRIQVTDCRKRQVTKVIPLDLAHLEPPDACWDLQLRLADRTRAPRQLGRLLWSNGQSAYLSSWRGPLPPVRLWRQCIASHHFWAESWSTQNSPPSVQLARPLGSCRWSSRSTEGIICCRHHNLPVQSFNQLCEQSYLSGAREWGSRT